MPGLESGDVSIYLSANSTPEIQLLVTNSESSKTYRVTTTLKDPRKLYFTK